MTDTITPIPMTLEQMKQIDGHIYDLLRLNRALKELDPEQEHYNHWDLLKPWVTYLVGWERNESSIVDAEDLTVRGYTLDELGERIKQIEIPRPPATNGYEAFLRSQIAYDMVLKEIAD